MRNWEEFDTLRIETPEGLDLYLPLAGFGPRLLAFFLDMLAVGLIQAVLFGILFFGIFFSAFSAAGSGNDAFMWVFIVVMVVVVAVTLLAPVLYFMIFETLWHGQSPGKRVAGIRVIRRGGYPAGRREIVWRNVLRIVDMLPSNWMVGLVSFFATRNQQRVGDLVADMVVVRENAGQQPVMHAPPASPWDAPAAEAAPGTLTPQLAYIIGSYLQRAPTLDVDMRESLSLRCIEALGYTGSHLSPVQREAYLASVVHAGWAAT